MVNKWLQQCFPCIASNLSDSAEWTTIKVEAADDGRKVNLSFKTLERTGKGTFGVVFKVQTDNDKILAMKQIDHQNKYKSREVTMMKSLDHMNVVAIHYFCQQKLFSKVRNIIFMEYMPGNLHSYISDVKTAASSIPPFLVCCYTYQLCRGLAHLHHRGIAHRDIKPRNLLVNTSSRVLKICDFGSAKKLEDQESNITYICSRWYRAPELLFGNKNYTVAVDVWSMGCCLAQMIRLEPLFRGNNTADQISKIFKLLGSPSEEEIDNLNVRDEHLPDAPQPRATMKEILFHECTELTECILLKLLQYDPTKRPSSSEALFDAYFNTLRNAASNPTNAEPLPDLFNFTREEKTYLNVPNSEEASPESPESPESPDSDS